MADGKVVFSGPISGLEIERIDSLRAILAHRLLWPAKPQPEPQT